MYWNGVEAKWSESTVTTGKSRDGGQGRARSHVHQREERGRERELGEGRDCSAAENTEEATGMLGPGGRETGDGPINQPEKVRGEDVCVVLKEADGERGKDTKYGTSASVHTHTHTHTRCRGVRNFGVRRQRGVLGQETIVSPVFPETLFGETESKARESRTLRKTRSTIPPVGSEPGKRRKGAKCECVLRNDGDVALPPDT